MAAPVETGTAPSNPETTPTLSQKLSYSAIIQNKPTLKKHSFNVTTVDGDQVVNVPDEILEGSTPLWEDLIIGRFPSTAPHVAKVHVIVNKIWPLGDKTVRIDAYEVSNNIIKFRIRDSSVRARVLRRGMWNIANMPMLVSKWTPIIEDAQPEIKTRPMCVTLKNVPHSMFSWEGISFLSSSVGEPKRLHPETELCKSFEEAKVFVEVDLTKILPKSFRFQSDKGVNAVVEYTYPWLPPKCSTCYKWGHLQDVCLAKEAQKEQSTLQSAAVSASVLQIQTVPSQPQEDANDENSGSVVEMITAETWQEVSPTKTNHSRVVTQEKQASLISPSRYSPLAMEDEDIETEEGEIETEKKEEEHTDNLKVVDAQGTRPSLPRTSKSTHKVTSGSSATHTKIPPAPKRGRPRQY
ncbi:unnamed protein product [Arabidopsis halleri]